MNAILISITLVAWVIIGVLLVRQIGGKADSFLASLVIAISFGIWLGSALIASSI